VLAVSKFAPKLALQCVGFLGIIAILRLEVGKLAYILSEFQVEILVGTPQPLNEEAADNFMAQNVDANTMFLQHFIDVFAGSTAVVH
jgi:hypothetical protein